MSDSPMDGPNATADEVHVGRALGQASLEVGLFAVPAVAIALIGAFVWRPAVLWLAVCGWVGLSLSLGKSRATEGIAIVRWPSPSSLPNKVTSAIAYNGTLSLGIFVSTIVWLGTRRFIIGMIVAAILPVWLLKHIQAILALDESI
jgi:hypothetical protein